MWILIAMSVIGVIALVASKAETIAGWFSPQMEVDTLFSEFQRDCEARGLSYGEAMAEWDVRTEFARYRREASDAVCADHRRWATILDEKFAAAVERMKMDGNAHLIPAFAGMCKGLPYNHILYDDASKLVDRIPIAPGGGLPSDRVAALRIVRPS